MIAEMTYLSLGKTPHTLPASSGTIIAAPCRAGIRLEVVEAVIAHDDLVRRFVRATQILQLGADRRAQAERQIAS